MITNQEPISNDIIHPLAILKAIKSFNKPGESKTFSTTINIANIEPNIDRTIGILTKLYDKSEIMKRNILQEKFRVDNNQIQEDKFIYTFIANTMPTYSQSEYDRIESEVVQPTDTIEFKLITKIITKYNQLNPLSKIKFIYLLAKTEDMNTEDGPKKILTYPDGLAITMAIDNETLTKAKDNYPRLEANGKLSVHSNKIKGHTLCIKEQNWRKMYANEINNGLTLIKESANDNIEKLKKLKNNWEKLTQQTNTDLITNEKEPKILMKKLRYISALREPG